MDKFKTYPKIKILGHEETEGILEEECLVYIEEKIDGANFRFMLRDGKIIFGSRNCSIGNSDNEIGGNWKRCVNHIKERLAVLDEEALKGFEGFIFYGENCVSHTMAYDWDNIPCFLGFDIYDFKTEKFLADKKRYFDKINLETVPLIKVISTTDANKITEKDIPESKYYHPQASNKLAEGIVIKNYDKQIFAKIVREQFKEENRKVFGLTKRQSINDEELIVSRYCTNTRIDKCIFNAIDDGNPLDMLIMEHLPTRVYNDIIEEHYKDICNPKYTISFRTLRKIVSTRCLVVLKQMIINNQLNK